MYVTFFKNLNIVFNKACIIIFPDIRYPAEFTITYMYVGFIDLMIKCLVLVVVDADRDVQRFVEGAGGHPGLGHRHRGRSKGRQLHARVQR